MDDAHLEGLLEVQLFVVFSVEDVEAVFLLLLAQVLLARQVVLVDSVEARHAAFDGGVDGDALAANRVENGGDSLSEAGTHYNDVADLAALSFAI